MTYFILDAYEVGARSGENGEEFSEHDRPRLDVYSETGDIT